MQLCSPLGEREAEVRVAFQAVEAQIKHLLHQGGGLLWGELGHHHLFLVIGLAFLGVDHPAIGQTGQIPVDGRIRRRPRGGRKSARRPARAGRRRASVGQASSNGKVGGLPVSVGSGSSVGGVVGGAVGEGGKPASAGWQAARISAITSNMTGRAASLSLSGFVFIVLTILSR